MNAGNCDFTLYRIVICTLSLIVIFFVSGTAGQLPDYVGPADRFWRHHVLQKNMVVEGVDHYHNIESCMQGKLTEDEWKQMSTIPNNRTVGNTISDSDTSKLNRENIFFVEVKNAMMPIHVKAVKGLASCVQEHIPSLYEARAMYLEFGLDEDPGIGGNDPTHLAPMIGIFLPEVQKEIIRTIQIAYDYARWNETLTIPDKETFSTVGEIRTRIHPEPKYLGFRASEHLTYTNFPLLASHNDGLDTAYTCNFAFSGPEDYEGGELYVIDSASKKTYVKPNKYSASVFLGGIYNHGVTEIKGGHREMFSNEMWFNPDIPVGSNLWGSTTRNMERYVAECNESGQIAGEECNATLPQYNSDETTTTQKADSLVEYIAPQIEPNFLVPAHVEVGELYSLYYRGSAEGVQNDEAYGIALPPELLEEFQAYVERNGMLEHARRLTYEEEPFQEGEHRLYQLNDGMTWGCMGPRWGGMDMVWIDPGDEKCFESMLSVLRRGNFDVVLDAIGNQFNLEGLMITGIGPIFLSHFEHDPEYNQIHTDLQEAKGSFYNVVVPIYIPEGGASLYVGDDFGKVLPIQMQYNRGIVLGAATRHGTAECDYREQRDVRLSVAIYLADVNEDNVEDIAGDNTSLWPTEGDIDWFMSQRGRLWRNDGSRSLKEDVGREPLKVEDKRGDCQALNHLCMNDPTGFRLECAESCRLYLQNGFYYSILEENKIKDANAVEGLELQKCESDQMLNHGDCSEELRSTDDSKEKINFHHSEKFLETRPWHLLYDQSDCDNVLNSSKPRSIYNQTSWEYVRNAYIIAVGIGDSTIENPISEKTGFHVPVHVGHSQKAGRGVFATDSIKKGTLIYSNSRQRAAFKSGKKYSSFLSSLSDDWICDLLSWCHVSTENLDDENSSRIICVLDNGSIVNNADGNGDYNLGRLEDLSDLCHGDCSKNFFAIRDIEKGEELRADYSEYIESPASDLNQNYDLFEW